MRKKLWLGIWGVVEVVNAAGTIYLWVRQINIGTLQPYQTLGIGLGIFFVASLALIFGFIYWYSKEKGQMQTTFGLKEVTEKQLGDAIREAKVVWGMWHSGDRVRNEKLFQYGTIKKVLLLDPYDNPVLEEIIVRAKEDRMDVINQIKSTTKLAKKQSVSVKWHKEYRELSILFCDSQPTEFENGDMIPSSIEATITVQVLEPKVSRELRHRYSISNKGKDSTRFGAFRDDFNDIWKHKSREPKEEEYL